MTIQGQTVAEDDAFICGVRRRQPRAEILWTRTICKEPGRYIGWPTVCRRKSGELIAVFSGDREAHVCPYGKVQLVRSTDGGETWSAPVTVRNSTLDDRDAGITELDNGDLLLVSFTSVCFMYSYRDYYDSVSAADRRRDCGYFSMRSTDGGRTWEPPVRMYGSANHGAVQLKDGRVLMAGRRRPAGGNFLPEDVKNVRHELVIEESTDRGRSWRILAKIEPQAPYLITDFHEPHLVEAADGRLVVLFRHHGAGASQVQCESSDGGRTWSPIVPSNVRGHPPHLLRLDDGTILCSSAVGSWRRAVELVTPSYDGGRTWHAEQAVELCAVADGDMGYPSTVRNADGTFVTVYYQKDNVKERPCLMATKWRLAPYDPAAEAAMRADAAKLPPLKSAKEFVSSPPNAPIRKIDNGTLFLDPTDATYWCQNVPQGDEITARFLIAVKKCRTASASIEIGDSRICFSDANGAFALQGPLFASLAAESATRPTPAALLDGKDVDFRIRRTRGELIVLVDGTEIARVKDSSTDPLRIGFRPQRGTIAIVSGSFEAKSFASAIVRP